MGLLYLNVAAAACTVGTNLMDGENFEMDNWYRKVVRIAVTGSDAAENLFILKYGDRRVAAFGTTRAADESPGQLDMIPINSRLVLRPGEPLVLECTHLAATNDVRIVMDIKDIRPGRGR